MLDYYGEQAQRHWDQVAKPLHSLGRLEELIVKIAQIQQTENVAIDKRCVLVFCADHGVVAQGISQSGQEVTALVARSIAEGTGNINLMAQTARMDVWAVDMGMAQPVEGVLPRAIARGTHDLSQGPAMTRQEAQQALRTGMDLVGEMKAQGYQIIATGEMGIGNTTASTAIACALLGLSPRELVGRGAGLSNAGLLRKQEAIEKALQINQPDPCDPMDVLAKVGGFEIAAMTGAFLGGMEHRMPIVIDGMISAVAALTAARLCPQVKDFMLPSHMSREPAMQRIMAELELKPILHGDMALGEGTGAAALLPLLDMALNIYHGPHTFEGLGMDAYTPQEEHP
ncbi:MAG: nicotinate-nucleotide--dimethylbenzimidazole phosphoribosyltransferase [Clostridia bacterium]|nr:nicotinate-nucleotide--dimethylbenzimidazole phosphoribosyltransferase [Clostridia bacterium]